MIRFALIFLAVFVLTFTMLLGIYAQAGLELVHKRMLPAFGVAFLVAAYVSFRVNMIIRRRLDRQGDTEQTAKRGVLGAIFGLNSESSSTRARRKSIEARRQELIQAGKLKEEADISESAPDSVRATQSVSIEERMAARRERVRKAKKAQKDQ